jgi:hypothetical protein
VAALRQPGAHRFGWPDFLVDRKQNMIVTAGYKIHPAKLERLTSPHPSVAMSPPETGLMN